jgi:hypothetical protein
VRKGKAFPGMIEKIGGFSGFGDLRRVSFYWRGMN